MVKIKRIKFFGFKLEGRSAEVVFSDGNVSVIYGKNGCGKTTFLKLISAFLSQDEDVLNSSGVTKVECDYLADGKVSSITLKSLGSDGGFNWRSIYDKPIFKTRSLSLGVERGISTQSSRVDAAIVFEYLRLSSRVRGHMKGVSPAALRDVAFGLAEFIQRRGMVRSVSNDDLDEGISHLNLQNLKLDAVEQMLAKNYESAKYSANLKIQSALFNTISDALEGNDGGDQVAEKVDIGTKVVEYKARMIEALTDKGRAPNQFQRKIVAILEQVDLGNYNDVVYSKPLLNSLFANMIGELDNEKLALSSINTLIKTFNDYLIDSKRLVVSGDEVFVEVSGVKHSVNELSSGERHILTFISTVLLLGSGRDFVIIDEPEISLNISWQRGLLDLFTKLLPEAQFILASHSPMIVQKRQESLSKITLGVFSAGGRNEA